MRFSEIVERLTLTEISVSSLLTAPGTVGLHALVSFHRARHRPNGVL
jgi:hypothetical protein